MGLWRAKLGNRWDERRKREKISSCWRCGVIREREREREQKLRAIFVGEEEEGNEGEGTAYKRS